MKTVLSSAPSDKLLPSWARAFRIGFAPQLADSQLVNLSVALLVNDPRIIQGATTTPLPLRGCYNLPLEAADPITFAAVGIEGVTVGQATDAFCLLCCEADKRLGGPGECRYLLNWYDEAPREDMLRDLRAEVDHVLAQRRLASTLPEVA